MIFGGFVKVIKSLETRVIVYVNTIVKHMDARTIFLDMKVLAWSIDLNGIKNKDIVKYPYPIGIKKTSNFRY